MSNDLTVHALCVVVLFLKTFATSCYQGLFRLSYRDVTDISAQGVTPCPRFIPVMILRG